MPRNPGPNAVRMASNRSGGLSRSLENRRHISGIPFSDRACARAISTSDTAMAALALLVTEKSGNAGSAAMGARTLSSAINAMAKFPVRHNAHRHRATLGVDEAGQRITYVEG